MKVWTVVMLFYFLVSLIFEKRDERHRVEFVNILNRVNNRHNFLKFQII